MKRVLFLFLLSVVGFTSHGADPLFEKYRLGETQKDVPSVLKFITQAKNSTTLEAATQVSEENFINGHWSKAQLLSAYQSVLTNRNLSGYQRKKVEARRDALRSGDTGLSALKKAETLDKGPTPRHSAEAYYWLAFHDLSKATDVDSLYGTCKAAAVVHKGDHERFFKMFFDRYPKDSRAKELFQIYSDLLDESYREGAGPSALPKEEQEKLEKIRKKVQF